MFNAYLNSSGYIDTLEKIKHIKSNKGLSYTKATLKSLLTNRLIIGKITNEGEHKALIPEDLFNKVQDKLAKSSNFLNNRKRDYNYLLKGKVRTTDGYLMQLTSTQKKNKRYYFYISQHAQKKGYKSCNESGVLSSINAERLEQLVRDLIYSSSYKYLSEVNRTKLAYLYINETDKLNRYIKNNDLSVVISGDGVELKFNLEQLNQIVELINSIPDNFSLNAIPKIEKLSSEVNKQIIRVRSELNPKRYESAAFRKLNNKSEYILGKLVEAKRLKKELYELDLNFAEFAKLHKKNQSDIRKLINLCFLSIKIQTKIIQGSLPANISYKKLYVINALDWNEQHRILGIKN